MEDKHAHVTEERNVKSLIGYIIHIKPFRNIQKIEIEVKKKAEIGSNIDL